MINILYAFLVVTGLGLLLGFGLAFAAKKLEVPKDPRLAQMEPIMPNANCGGCGYPGCAGYAAAVVAGEAPIGLCAPGGSELSRKMAEIMGLDSAPVSEKMVAFVHCIGSVATTNKDYRYEGMTDCNAASLLFSGDNSCKSGCLRLGSCIKVCPADAISRQEDGRIVVDPDLCIGCKKCTAVCPNGVIKMVPASATYVVACNNHESGAKVRKACSVGCIGCKICENKFPESGCKVVNFLSEIDYSSSQAQIVDAANACPQKCIVPMRGGDVEAGMNQVVAQRD
ncbi:MAG: RnfABCDGE type electron transport complex subunit B [Sphaerochaetaceae bacterium]|jgi:Na+-translocating ferredoxin:NAD+ oxidoreductase RNF subunit RnfB